MLTLTIDNISPELQAQLQQEAICHHRSMAQQALLLLEQCLLGKTSEFPKVNSDEAKPWPEPLKPGLPTETEEWPVASAQPNQTTREALRAIDNQEGLETVTLEQLKSFWQQAEKE